MKAPTAETGHKIIIALSGIFFALVTWTSYARWVNFEYRTFDLAYYVQAIWQLIHGRLDVSIIQAPLLGNHVEPIVFLFAPFFALIRHPMLFVVLQNAALAAMAPIGYRMARRLGFDTTRACLLGAILLVTPACGFIALHEFHPEALTAPFLLLMLDARMKRSLALHWIWFVAVLACKENMALLLAAYCMVNLVVERRAGWNELARWYFWPLLAALFWFALCSAVITPALNSGNIDYLALYDRLGNSGTDILRNAVIHPQLIGRALFQSLTHGNLVWALLIPFLGLPLLRPRWLVISGPILLQHLLSWRSSEWTIYFHYAAPVLPLFWIATVEAIAPCSNLEGVAPSTPTEGTRRRASLQGVWIPCVLLIACLTGQAWLGPAAAISSEAALYSAKHDERARKNAFLAQIPVDASVVAPLPYLSHLAQREKLYSLHYILKGLKTLSHASYEPPPPTDYVLIDYGDNATFDAGAGYYHPAMQTRDGRVIPSSDQLLHNFLKQAEWEPNERDELALLHKKEGAPAVINSGVVANTDERGRYRDGSTLLDLTKSGDFLSDKRIMEIDLVWSFPRMRTVFPWMVVKLSQNGRPIAALTKGLCAPEVSAGATREVWRISSRHAVPAGTYQAEAIFTDEGTRAWSRANGPTDAGSILLSPPISLGDITIK